MKPVEQHVIPCMITVSGRLVEHQATALCARAFSTHADVPLHVAAAHCRSGSHWKLHAGTASASCGCTGSSHLQAWASHLQAGVRDLISIPSCLCKTTWVHRHSGWLGSPVGRYTLQPCSHSSAAICHIPGKLAGEHTKSCFTHFHVAGLCSQGSFTSIDSTDPEQGDAGESFFLLALGTAAAYKAGSEQPSGTLKAGSYFGERALHVSEPR